MENVGNKSDTFPSMRTFYALRSEEAFLINTAQGTVAGDKVGIRQQDISIQVIILREAIERLLQPNYLVRIM